MQVIGQFYQLPLALPNKGNGLARNGVPAPAIVVIGKGETQPLVQTADGVREPQNRRVDIVLQ